MYYHNFKTALYLRIRKTYCFYLNWDFFFTENMYVCKVKEIMQICNVRVEIKMII